MRKVERDGELYSQDHASLYVSNKRSALTTKLIAGAPHSLLLQDANGELHVLVPSLEPTRPRLGAFSTALVLRRDNAAWSRALDTHYYLYPAHISLSFLVCPTLASSLYLLLLHFLHRDYAKAFALATSVGVDYAFSAEEANVFRALARAGDDAHPDAHALRLKIASVLADSDQDCPWDMAVEALWPRATSTTARSSRFVADGWSPKRASAAARAITFDSPNHRRRIGD